MLSGIGAFLKSTVVKRLVAGDYDGAADAFLMFDRAGHKEVQGLLNRREKERDLFLA